MEAFDKEKLLPKKCEEHCVDISFPFTHSNTKYDKLDCLGMCYISSARVLFNAKNKLYTQEYYILPLLQLLNHGIELSIKSYLIMLDDKVNEIHDIVNLFKTAQTKIQEKITKEQFDSIPWDNTLNIIQVIYNELLNEKNIAYRYPIKKCDNNYEIYKYANGKDSLYINIKYLGELIAQLELFFSALSSYIGAILEYENI